ncbi:Hypothetical predicted protein [Pelobates cultripes]|uniref:Uncharacterized protein n=1 Tax=Pelobates cultripes TaxID=61616 RepID=A0AAD1SRY1_PELCU|nr:Hypothetical predicted protein [Pelobates cultripes]
MSKHKYKKSTSSAEKQKILGQKSSSASEVMRALLQDGADDSDASNPIPTVDDFKKPDSLTKGYFEKALESMSTKLIQTWQATADQIRKEILDLNARTTHVQSKCKEFALAHNGACAGTGTEIGPHGILYVRLGGQSKEE